MNFEQAVGKTNSTPSNAPKATTGGQQTAQYSSTNSGAVSSLAPPATQVAARRERKGISMGERISLDPEFKNTAKKLEAVGFFKPGDYDKLMNNANDAVELKAWMDGLKALYEDAVEKRRHTVEPSPNPATVAKDKEAFKNAKEKLTGTVQQYLNLVPVDNSLSSGWSLGSLVTVHVAPVLAPVAVVQNAITHIPDDATVTESYNGHGNFVPLGGGAGMTTGGLLQYVRSSRDHFELSNNQFGHNFTMFSLYLGESAMDNQGKTYDWYITIRYYANTNSAVIDHFGPFGPATGGGVS